MSNALISGAALVLASVALGAYDQTMVRRAMVDNLSIQAQMVASNSVSALTFNDPATAEVTLGALRAAPHIVSARIHAADEQEFATYGRPTDPLESLIPAGQVESHRFTGTHLVLHRSIVLQSKPIGRVSIVSDLQELAHRRNQYVRIVTVVLAAALLCALLLSWLSQRAIARPITELSTIARAISVDKDYSVRAASTGNFAEIRVLTDAFNDMLAEIQERDRSLSDAHEALEARVHQRTAELDAANKELEAFSYSVSHDLRAPLRHVSGFAELLQNHLKDHIDDKARRYLHTIISSAGRMGRLIDDLLAFSRIGRSQLASQRVRLGDITREAREEIISQNGVGTRTIQWQIDELPDVQGDPALLRQVMLNLLSNAVKYSAPRSTARIEVGSRREKDEVVVYVRDNGVGFDMQYADKLFGVFQRLHRADEFEGTGVGLANVGRIIRRHGGRVWAEGQVDQGASFYFSLPLTRPRARDVSARES
jgi:signal transduction histidine kinase